MDNFNEINFCGNRHIAVKALVGSHNYNLNTSDSDKDYKYFVFPTFDDLYHIRMFNNNLTSPALDATCHDVRQLVELVWKANLNFIEVLYSTNARFDPSLQFMVDQRDQYATMNLYTFFKASYGMHLEKIKDLHKGTTDTTKLVEKFGYDTKQACHALRCLFVISRFMKHQDMGSALWFATGEEEREILLSVKAGEYKEDEVLNAVNEWHALYKENAEAFYREQTPNEERRIQAQNLLRVTVQNKLDL